MSWERRSSVWKNRPASPGATVQYRGAVEHEALEEGLEIRGHDVLARGAEGEWTHLLAFERWCGPDSAQTEAARPGPGRTTMTLV
jgi:hypothetical protein